MAAAVLAAIVGLAVPLVYGNAFAESIGPLRVLLVGSVLYAGAAVLFSGLYALNRPFTAALSQAGGIFITVAGLLLFLEDGGIWAAAIVSSVAYAAVFLSAAALYRRAASLTWRELVPERDAVRRSWRLAARQVFARPG